MDHKELEQMISPKFFCLITSAMKVINLDIQWHSTNPETGYPGTDNPDRLLPSCKYVENSTKLICLLITGFRIKYSTVLWLLELQIRRGRKV